MGIGGTDESIYYFVKLFTEILDYLAIASRTYREFRVNINMKVLLLEGSQSDLHVGDGGNETW